MYRKGSEGMDNGSLNNKIKIAFFAKQGMDSFLDELINGLIEEYETKKIVVTEYTQIDEGMKWADICWFEWCDELIAYGSKSPLALLKKIICRLHSYEAFTDYPSSVNWNTVDRLIFVGEHIREFTIKKFNIDREKTVVIPNGINIDRYTFKERTYGFNIAYVGYINYKKGPMLLMHTFKAIYDKDPRYKLHIAGSFQDERDILYFMQMIEEMGLQNNIIYSGWQDDINNWLEDKDYILCTSILESQNISVMQAMAKGIKPIIHNFVGAKKIYPEEYIFNTINEAVDMLTDKYNSKDYRRYIESFYDMNRIIKKIKNEIISISSKDKNLPLVSIIMTVYNKEKYLKEAIESILEQSYRNIELIIVNDGSTDGSENIIKSFSDNRIKYFCKSNSGQLDTLKYGLNMASGEYIARVDSDDRIDIEYIKTCIENIMSDNALEFVYTDFVIIDRDGNEIDRVHFCDYNSPYEVILDMFAKFTSVIPDTGFWKKDYIGNVISNYCEQNIPYYIDNILKCKFRHIKKALYYYRKHDSNFAAVNMANQKLLFEGKIKFMDFIIRRYFIQLDISGDFINNKEKYYNLFTKKYLNLAEVYRDAGKELVYMFLEEAGYWFKKYSELSYNEEEKSEISRKIKSIAADNNDFGKSGYRYKNKRVLIVSTDDPKDGKAVGGKHVHISLLLNGLKECNIPGCLITYAYDSRAEINIKEFMKDFNLKDNDISNIKNPNFLYLVYAIQKQLEDKIEKKLLETYISHINCHDVIAAAAAKNVLNRLNLEIPVITTLHGYFTYENKDYGLLDDDYVYDFFLNYEKKAYEISNRIIAVDSRIKEYVSNLLGEYDINKISVIKNAVNNLIFKPDSDNTDAYKNNFILVPRRLVPKNGVIYAVKAAHELVKNGIINFKLLIAGDGIERSRIESYIKDNCLGEYIKLLGSISHDEIYNYYKTSKIILIPSVLSNNVEEATSLSALEGMASGKIVVASNIGGLKEIIRNGYNGYLVEPGDPEELASILNMIMNLDYESYSLIGMRAHDEVEMKHGYINHTKEYLEIFDNVRD